MSNDPTDANAIGVYKDEATGRSVDIYIRKDMQFGAQVDGRWIVAESYASLTEALKETLRQGADLWQLMVFVTAKGGHISGYTADEGNAFVRLGLSANRFWAAKIGDVWYKADWQDYNAKTGRDVRYEKKTTWHVGNQAHFDGRGFAWGDDLFLPYTNLLWSSLEETAANLGGVGDWLEKSLSSVAALEEALQSPLDLAGLHRGNPADSEE